MAWLETMQFYPGVRSQYEFCPFSFISPHIENHLAMRNDFPDDPKLTVRFDVRVIVAFLIIGIPFAISIEQILTGLWKHSGKFQKKAA